MRRTKIDAARERAQGHEPVRKPPYAPKSKAADSDVLKLVFDSIHNGAMVTDAEGYVTHFNKPYGEFLGVIPEDQIGRHCSEVVENSRMHIVAKTGKPEFNFAHVIKGQSMVVQRIPMRKNGRVIGVFGQVMFKDVRDVTKLAKKLSLLESKVALYEKELLSIRSTRHTLESIVGGSEAIRSLKKEAQRAAANRFPVLITGESGTGKELFAQGIHHAGPRRIHPFVRINCAAIPKDLLESELFGYEKGAFTGARESGKPGKLELAGNGTLFLDEIADLPLSMQPKLLRVLEDKEFERVGGTTVIRSDFRLIAATNLNIEEMVADGRFRKDLFYRLAVIPLFVPPLRERQEDILPIALHLLRQIAEEAGYLDIKLHPLAQEALVRYPWPGNVRELSNVLDRVVSSLDDETIHLCDLPFHVQPKKRAVLRTDRPSLRETQTNAERDAIIFALKSARYNKAEAARILGIHRTHLYKKMKKCGLVPGPENGGSAQRGSKAAP